MKAVQGSMTSPSRRSGRHNWKYKELTGNSFPILVLLIRSFRRWRILERSRGLDEQDWWTRVEHHEKEVGKECKGEGIANTQRWMILEARWKRKSELVILGLCLFTGYLQIWRHITYFRSASQEETNKVGYLVPKVCTQSRMAVNSAYRFMSWQQQLRYAFWINGKGSTSNLYDAVQKKDFVLWHQSCWQVAVITNTTYVIQCHRNGP